MRRRNQSRGYLIKMILGGLLASVFMTAVYISLRKDYGYEICNWLQEYSEDIRTECESKVDKMGKQEQPWAFGLFWLISTGALIAWVDENE